MYFSWIYVSFFHLQKWDRSCASDFLETVKFEKSHLSCHQESSHYQTRIKPQANPYTPEQTLTTPTNPSQLQTYNAFVT